MQGIAFNLLQEVVSRQHGEDAGDDLLERAGATGASTSVGGYSDEELDALVTAASDTLGIPRAAVLRWFGQQDMPMLAAHSGEAVDFRHDQCVDHGDPQCLLEIRWLPQAA